MEAGTFDSIIQNLPGSELKKIKKMNMKKLLLVLMTLVTTTFYQVPLAVAQQPCGAGFQYTITTSPNGTIISFYDSSYAVGTITNWDWVFDNGQVSTQQNPVLTVN